MTDTQFRSPKEARFQRILAGLTAREREALYRFYTLKENTEQISQALGLGEAALQKLAARVKRAFTAARHSQ